LPGLAIAGTCGELRNAQSITRFDRTRDAGVPDATLIAASGCAASQEQRDHRGDVQQQSRELPATASASFQAIFVIFVHSWSPRK
jgi:hypothetical protein